MPEQLMYIKWDLDTGKIVQISGAPIPDSITVPLSIIENVVLGKESVQHYRVKYNTKEKRYELLNDKNFELLTHNVQDWIYLVNPNDVTDQDLTITQDITNKLWTFEINKPVPVDKVIWFAVTERDNPNVLIRSFNINLKELSEESVSFDFINTEYESLKDVSIFTTRTFDEYKFTQVGV